MRLEPFRLERFFTEHEFTVRHLACSSDAQTLTTDELLAPESGAAEQFARLSLGYTETHGHPALRQAIAALDGFDPAHVLVHTGGEEPIFTFMHAALEPGDELICHVPTYQSLTAVARSRGIAVRRWHATEETGWQPDPDALKRLLSPRTRAVVLNVPNNPTGAVISRQAFNQVVAFVERHGLWLLGDEVYRGLEHQRPPLPPVAHATARGVSLGAMAKVYGLAGLRIGWAVTQDAQLQQRMARVKDYLTICAPAPSEFLATVALRQAETLRQRSLAIVRENVTRFETTISHSQGRLQWVRPQAGTIGFARVRDSAEAFCAQTLASCGVLFAPANLFEAGDRHIRVGLGRTTFDEAMHALEASWR
jgi:aspartate/methionine/tyrosine aminotransferase